MVLPASGTLVDSLNPFSRNSLGLRVPNCKLAIDLLSRSGPLATTSANLTGHSPCLSAWDSFNCFPGIPLLAPVPWETASGTASTILEWKNEGSWEILRIGAVNPF